MQLEWGAVEQRYREDEAGYAVTIVAPDGEPYTLPNGEAFQVWLAGPSALSAQAARLATAQQFLRFVQLDDKGEPQVTVPDPYEASTVVASADVERIARMVRRWNLIAGENGSSKPVPCTLENARVLLSAQPDILRQLKEADAQRTETFRRSVRDAATVRKVARSHGAPNAGREGRVRASEAGGKKRRATTKTRPTADA